MVHGVTGGCFTVHLFVVHLVIFGERFQFLRGGVERQKCRIKVAHVRLEHFRCVALRIHRHKQALQALTVLAQQFLHFGQFGHGRGADIGTLRVAKEQHHHFAGKVLDAARLTIVVDQRKILGVVGTGEVDGGKTRLFLGTGRKNACSQRHTGAGSYKFKSTSFVHD